MNPNIAKAIREAEEGDAQAQCFLGCLFQGKDDAKAVEWWRKAAEQGHAEAQ